LPAEGKDEIEARALRDRRIGAAIKNRRSVLITGALASDVDSIVVALRREGFPTQEAQLEMGEDNEWTVKHTATPVFLYRSTYSPLMPVDKFHSVLILPSRSVFDTRRKSATSLFGRRPSGVKDTYQSLVESVESPSPWTIVYRDDSIADIVTSLKSIFDGVKPYAELAKSDKAPRMLDDLGAASSLVDLDQSQGSSSMPHLPPLDDLSLEGKD
jgi:hypothetical protein